MFILSICGDNLHDGTRTILKQLRPKLFKNLGTNLGQNLLVLIKKACTTGDSPGLSPFLTLYRLYRVPDKHRFSNAPFCRRFSRTQSYKERFGLSTAA